MSSPKPKAKPSVNQQVKAGLSAIKDFLAGRSGEANIAATDDKATREVVAEELLATMSGRSAEAGAAEASGSDWQKIARFDAESAKDLSSNSVQRVSESTTEATASPLSESLKTHSPSGNQEQFENSNEHEQERVRARKLFLDHGYFDEAVQNLGAANSPAERAAAARTLGLVGSQRATPHLIAAMFDDDVEVRNAAEAALRQIGDPTATTGPVDVALNNEVKRNLELEGPNSGVIRRDEPAAPTIGQAAELEGSEATQPGARDARGPSEEVVSSSPTVASVEIEATPEPGPVRATGVSEWSVSSSSVPSSSIHPPAHAGDSDQAQLLAEEQSVKERVEQLALETLEIEARRKESEQEIRRSVEREAKLRAEAMAQRVEEEKLRKQTQEEAERQRAESLEALNAEHQSRLQVEAEVVRLDQEETSLRVKAADLRQEALEFARQRAALETANIEATEAAKRAEATRARDGAKAHHEAQLVQLRTEEEALHTTAEEVALRKAQVIAVREEATQAIARLQEEQAAAEAAQHGEADRLRREAEARNREAEEQLRLQLEVLRQAGQDVAARHAGVEAAREQADAEAQRLVEARARMRDAAAARAQAELERAQLEAEINQQVETALRLLEESRRRGQQEQERVQDETRRHAEKEQRRVAELDALKSRAEEESKQLAERERRILGEVDSLRITDAETRRQIEEAEVRKRGAEDAYRLIAEKVQRVKAEAHARVKEEEQMRAKLEAERRTVAVAAQSRADQEKRIREEIEMFRRLEEQERPRIEEAVLQRTEAEARLEQWRESVKPGDGEQVNVAGQLNENWRNQESSPVEVSPTTLTAAEETARAANASVSQSAPEKRALSNGNIGDMEGVDDVSKSHPVPPSIAAYLNSVDPYKRAAAVAELARSRPQDAFALIANCFDDHSTHVRNAAARAFRKLEPNRTVDLFNKALEEASNDRRRNIGGAIAASGLATEAINNLVSENREDTYNALSILFVMAKTGEVEPLVRALEEHPDDEIGKAVTKLLTLSGYGKQ